MEVSHMVDKQPHGKKGSFRKTREAKSVRESLLTKETEKAMEELHFSE